MPPENFSVEESAPSPSLARELIANTIRHMPGVNLRMCQ
jgi:hypothetical protein